MRVVNVYYAVFAAFGLFPEHGFLLSHNMLDHKKVFALVLVERYTSVLSFVKQSVYFLNIPFQIVDLKLYVTSQHLVRLTSHLRDVQILFPGFYYRFSVYR